MRIIVGIGTYLAIGVGLIGLGSVMTVRNEIVRECREKGVVSVVGNLFSVYDALSVYGTGSHLIESFVNRDVLESYDLASLRACFREAVRLYPYSSQKLNDTAFAFYCKPRTLRFQSVPTKHRMTQCLNKISLLALAVLLASLLLHFDFLHRD